MQGGAKHVEREELVGTVFSNNLQFGGVSPDSHYGLVPPALDLLPSDIGKLVFTFFFALTALAPGWEGLAADGAAKKGADTFSCFLEQNLTRF